jgi:hypothetical protein
MGTPNLIPVPRSNDAEGIRRAIAGLARKVGIGGSPTFANVTITGLTASRLVATDASKMLVSTNAHSWISGTANQVTVTNDGDGTCTLSLPQDIHAAATPTFSGLTLTGFTGVLWANAGVVTSDATLDLIGNLAADKTFNNGNNSVSFNFIAPSGSPTYDGAFEIQASGAFVGDLFHVHQHTGNPGTTDLIHAEAVDADVTLLRLYHSAGSGTCLAVGNHGANVATIDAAGNAVLNDLTITTPVNIYALSHNSFADSHNLTTDIDHDALTNFVAGEHFLQTEITNVSSALTTGLLKVTTGTGALSVVTDNSANWNTAYGWGDHSVAGYAMSGGAEHDGFSDFVANEHINHTSVSISAGTGLTGGGDISANRTISLSHLGVESLTDPNANRLLGWDDTDGAMKFLTIGDNLSYDHATHTLSATGGGSFVMRSGIGETADFTQADFPDDDDAWHDLDVSSIVPAGTTLVVFRLAILATEANKKLRIRPKGTSWGNNTAPSLRTQVANLGIDGLMVCPVDSNRYIQYSAQATTWSAINMVVMGWFI